MRIDAGLDCRSPVRILRADHLYAAEVGERLCMKIGPGSWSPCPEGDWAIAAFGHNYCVWIRT